MRLESARELRNNLDRLLSNQSTRGADMNPVARVIHRWSQTLKGEAEILDGLALGIAPGPQPHQYKLAIRIARASQRRHELVTAISSMARSETDVRVTGLISAQGSKRPQTQDRYRPLRAGASVGHYQTPAGTLGFFARRGAEIGFVSNNHILADCNRANEMDPILQPGTTDGGEHPRDEIGELVTFVRLQTRGKNLVDAAFAKLVDEHNCGTCDVLGIGPISGIADEPTDFYRVVKSGRATGFTEGEITAFEVSPVVHYLGLPPMTFGGQIEIAGTGNNAFSRGGDSGALILDMDGAAVAMLFACSQKGADNDRGLTYANPVGRVLSALEVQLLQ